MMSVRRLMEKARKEGMNREQFQALVKAKKDELDCAVSQQDLLSALSKVSKSVGEGDLQRYQAWMNEYGSI